MDIKKYFTFDGTKDARTNNFNIIRFIAAAMVIYGHMCHIMGVPVYCVFGQAVSTLAVKILFAISGYLIMKSYMADSNFFRFMVRRCFRIFPALIGVVLFSIFIVGPIFTALPVKEYFKNSNTWLYLKNIILYPIYALPGVFGNYTYPNAVNGSLWTLPTEFALYLILPFFLCIFKKKKGFICVIVLTALSVIGNLVRLKWFPTARYVLWGSNLPDSLALLPYFFIGCLWAYPEMKRFLSLQISTCLLLATLVFQFGAVKTELITCITLPYFILSFATADMPVFAKWFTKVDFSYGLYLYGFVIQQALYHQIQKLNNPIFSLNVSFAICFIATLICAIVSWYLIEAPTQKLGKKIVAWHKNRQISK